MKNTIKIYKYLLRGISTKLHIFLNRFSKPNLLKKFQYLKIKSLCERNNSNTFLEFGSGASTIFFIKNLKKLNELLSVNLLEEKKYTDKVIEKIKIYDSKIKVINILNLKHNKLSINNKETLRYEYDFKRNYDFIYIDGPSNILGNNLIYNILNLEIRSSFYFFDGRYEMFTNLLLVLKKKNIEYKVLKSVLLNYYLVEIKDKNFFLN